MCEGIRVVFWVVSLFKNIMEEGPAPEAGLPQDGLEYVNHLWLGQGR